MITSILKDLTVEIPGRAAVMGVLEDLMESAWSRLKKVLWDSLVEGTKGFLKNNEASQRIIKWRIASRGQEERMLVSRDRRGWKDSARPS